VYAQNCMHAVMMVLCMCCNEMVMIINAELDHDWVNLCRKRGVAG
jgi:hypothetical protein